MMTREEAIKAFEEIKVNAQNNLGAKWAHGCDGYYRNKIELTDAALKALRPVSREQVEKMRGEWIDIDGEKVPVDKYGQPFGWAQCSACGEYLTASDEYPCIGHFCPNCGAPMTDEAVEMVMERAEAVYGQASD